MHISSVVISDWWTIVHQYVNYYSMCMDRDWTTWYTNVGIIRRKRNYPLYGNVCTLYDVQFTSNYVRLQLISCFRYLVHCTSYTVRHQLISCFRNLVQCSAYTVRRKLYDVQCMSFIVLGVVLFVGLILNHLFRYLWRLVVFRLLFSSRYGW